MVGLTHAGSILPILNTASNTGWWKQGPTYEKLYTARIPTLIPWLQHYKKAKSETDACVERLNRITDKEPIREMECENLISVVSESRNKM